MPDMTEQTNGLIGWLSTNGIVLAVIVIVLWLTYRWTRPAIHRVLTRLIQAQTKALEPGSSGCSTCGVADRDLGRC